MTNYTLISSILVVLGLNLQGCAPVAIVGAGGAVMTSASEERGLGGTLSDKSIETQIQFKWTKSRYDLFSALSIAVRQGRVLLTGTVPTTEEQIEAIRLVWTVSGVREVINEIEVGQMESVGAYTKNTWISTQLKSKLLFAENVESLNYTIKTIKGVVYLMGVAQNKEELETVIHIARHIAGVTKVISYVTVKPQTQKLVPQNSSPSRQKSSAYTQKIQRSSPINDQNQRDTRSVARDVPAENFDDPLLSGSTQGYDIQGDEIAVERLDAPNTHSSFR